jgi:hypothetical protein
MAEVSTELALAVEFLTEVVSMVAIFMEVVSRVADSGSVGASDLSAASDVDAVSDSMAVTRITIRERAEETGQSSSGLRRLFRRARASTLSTWRRFARLAP